MSILGLVTDYGRLVRKSPSLHGRKSNPKYIDRYNRGIFCLPHWPNISDFFDLCLHWVSVVRGPSQCATSVTWTVQIFGHFFQGIFSIVVKCVLKLIQFQLSRFRIVQFLIREVKSSSLTVHLSQTPDN